MITVVSGLPRSGTSLAVDAMAGAVDLLLYGQRAS
jgi:hypothetical protein